MTRRSSTGVRSISRLSACGLVITLACSTIHAAEEPPHSAELDAMIEKQAKLHGVPEKLVRRVVMRESRYNPRARNHSFWGLMQISYPTAKSMGFKGSPSELLNPLVNLTYAVPYLANAFVIAGKREDAAVRLYASGYYDTAKRRGLLGVLRTADSTPVSGVSDTPTLAAAAPAQQSYGVFGGLFGADQPQQVAYNTPAAESAPAASPAVQEPAAASQAPATSPAQGPDHGDASASDVEMHADKNGQLKPPAKWLHDGGTTMMVRGEQSVEKIAAYETSNGNDKDARRHTASRRSHKSTAFASLDAPPASAQAYAAVAGSQDSSLASAAPQTAISQFAARPMSSSPSTDAGEQAAAQAAAEQAAGAPQASVTAAAPAQPTTAERHASVRHSRHARAKAHGKDATSTTMASQRPDDDGRASQTQSSQTQ